MDINEELSVAKATNGILKKVSVAEATSCTPLARVLPAAAASALARDISPTVARRGREDRDASG